MEAKVGRPRKFETPEQMQEAIDKYFEECDKAVRQVITKEGKVVTLPDPDPYTIEGLAIALGMTRQTLLTYEKTDLYKEFSDTIKMAKQKVGANLNRRGLKGENVASVAIFNLKNNFGYKDQQEVAVTDKVFEVEF